MNRIHADGQTPLRLATIDLGSNSFHLLVANYQGGQLQAVAKLSEKVRLAAGLDDDNLLSEEAMERALSCLARFVPFLENIPARHLRVVGTNTLRAASNSQALIEQAERLLGHDIEIISGREEARLIYLGAAHALADVHGNRLIMDIGGGSTELIIGRAFQPFALESLDMGCVTYSQRFFPEGKITEKGFQQAELAALSELVNIRRHYMELGWSDPVGSSGTIKAVAVVLAANGGAPDGLIDREGLGRLRKQLIKSKHVTKLAMVGLKPERANVLPGGMAILCAIFEVFGLASIRYSDGALREGVLHDLAGRNTAEDSRLQAIDILFHRYAIERRQAEHVTASAMHACDQVQDPWQLNNGDRQLLAWAAQLHELGLAVSHSQFHHHGAYLLEHSDLPGFTRNEQRALAFLVRAHRRKFPRKELELLPASARERYARLARLLRLAVILNHARPEHPVTGFRLVADGDALLLSFPDMLSTGMLMLMLSDLQQEKTYQCAVGFILDIDQFKDG